MKNTSISFTDVLKSLGTFRIKSLKLIDHIAGYILTCILPSNNTKPSHIDSTINQILIIRPGGIGDALLLLPSIRALKNKFPNIQIDILCEQRNAQVFSSQKDLNLSIFNILSREDQTSVLNKEYDFVIDTEQWHYLTAIFTYFTNAKNKIGFSTRPKRSKFFNHKIPYSTTDHELNNFNNLFKSILQNTILKQNIEDSFQVSNSHQFDIKEKYCCLFIGSSLKVKRLSKVQIEEIINICVSENLKIYLIGGKDVINLTSKIMHEHHENIENYVGKLSLSETAELIKKALFCISPDSGIMHLSYLVGTPTIALFGPSNSAKWQPIGTKNLVISENLFCSPCASFGYTVPTCKHQYQCMKNLKIESIKPFIKSLNK